MNRWPTTCDRTINGRRCRNRVRYIFEGAVIRRGYCTLHSGKGYLSEGALPGWVEKVTDLRDEHREAAYRASLTPIGGVPMTREEGEDPKYHSGTPCVEPGCPEPAGTAWTPYWCARHDRERMERISASLERLLARTRGEPG